MTSSEIVKNSNIRNLKQTKIFVIIFTDKLGDTLLCNSLVQNIKHIYTNSKVVGVINPELVDAVKYQYCMDEVILWDRKGTAKSLLGTLKFVKNFPYKNIYAIILNSPRDRNLILSRLIKSKYKIFAASSLLKKIFFQKIKYPIKSIKKDVVKVSEGVANLLSAITNNKIINYPIKFNVFNTNLKGFDILKPYIGKYIVFAPISAAIEKDISLHIAEEFVSLMSDYKIVILGSGNIIQEYSPVLSKYTNVIDLSNKTTIPELAEILKNSRASICVDSGIMHLSYAVETPTLCIFNNPYPIFEPDLELYNVQILYKPTSAEEIVVNVKNFISGERILN